MTNKPIFIASILSVSVCLIIWQNVKSVDNMHTSDVEKPFISSSDISHESSQKQLENIPLTPATFTIKNKTKETVSLNQNTADFLGISRRSETAESFLSDAGVLPVDLDGAEFIEFDIAAIQKLEVGQSFDLEIPQTAEIFTAEVTQVQIFENGDKNIIGNIVGLDDSLHNTIITVGKDALYGQFTTVSGNWVFESKDQYGWMAAKRDLYRSHVELEAVELNSTTKKGAKDIFSPSKP